MFQSIFGEGLSKKVRIYVPSTVNVRERASKELIHKWVIATHEFLTGKFGGATSQEGLGSYKANDGTLVIEDVVIVTAFASKVTDADIEDIAKFIGKIKAAFSQEYISVEGDDELFFG